MSPFSLHHAAWAHMVAMMVTLGPRKPARYNIRVAGIAPDLQSALVAVVGDRHLATLRVPIARDKVGRLCGQAKFEAGRVRFPKGASFLLSSRPSC